MLILSLEGFIISRTVLRSQCGGPEEVGYGCDPGTLGAAAHVENKPLAEAMGDEAWKTVKNTADFTPKEAPKGHSATKGYGISGRVTNVVRQGSSVQVFSAFTVWVDGTLSNVAPIQGSASAEGSNTAEDAVRAITADRIEQILKKLKTGGVRKAG